MLRNTLLQLRSNLGRVSAAGLAIVLGVGFVAASLVFAGTMQSSIQRMIAAPHLAADIVVSDKTYQPGGDGGDLVERVRSVPGVASTAPRLSGSVRLSEGKGRGYVRVRRLAEDPRLRWYELTKGSFPSSGNGIVVDAAGAESAGLKVGDTVTLTSRYYGGGTQAKTLRTEATISGFVDMGKTLLSGGGTPTMFASPELMRQLHLTRYSFIDLTVAEGADTQSVLNRVRDAVDEGIEVHTGERQAEIAVEELGGGVSTAINSVLLPFAGIALFVAGFVIVNTFSILHAQRSRQYALLRCVGATRAQIRRSALIESLIIGVVASLLGTVLGILVTATVGWPLGLTDSPVDLASLGISVWALVVPMLTGVVVTFLASLAPAGRAMRVAPLAALRPVPDEQAARRIGRVRLIFAVILLVIGSAMLLGGAFVASLLLAVPGAMLAALGVLLFTPTLIPATARLFGRILRLFGPTGVLATGNAVRNPYRASSTSTALMIGVGLIVLLMTGTATAEVSAQHRIDRKYPVDATVVSDEGALPPDLAGKVRELKGTAATAVLRGTEIKLGHSSTRLLGIERDKLVEVARHGGRKLRPGTALVNPGIMEYRDWSDDQRVSLPVGTGELPVRVIESELVDYGTIVVSASTLASSEVDVKPVAVWARATEGADLNELVDELKSLAESSSGTSLDIGGAAPKRAMVNMMLDVLLLVVTGLLGVAVIIAVVGIANTLGLSVLERGRESALLRALGLTRGQLRGTLAAEAILLAVVGAVLGAVLGVVFAWGGAAALFGQVGMPVTLAVPWLKLLLILGCAVLAGVLASVLPARRAAKATPAAALAEE